MKTAFFGANGAGGGLVSSVFGRIGAVIATVGDYAASLIANDSGVVGATVDLALDALDRLATSTSKGLAPIVLPGNNVLLADGANSFWSPSLILGALPALAGTIRLPRNFSINVLDSTGLADFTALHMVGNRLTMEVETAAGGFAINSPGGFLWGTSSSGLQVASTVGGVAGATSFIQFEDIGGGLECVYQIKATSTANGRKLVVYGQNAATNGGDVVQGSGGGGGGGGAGAGKHGRYIIQLGGYVNGVVSGIGARMLELANLGTVSAQARVASFFRNSNISLTEVPDGDGIAYIGDAGTIPTASPTNGHEYYSDGQRPAWLLGNGTKLRVNGTSTTATTGALPALPALPTGYLDVQINGVQSKIPFYSN